MAFYRERDLKGFAKEVTSDGIGIGGGFIVGGAVGRQVENMLMKDPVGPDSPIAKKFMAWAANNGAKAILYVLAKRYDAQTEITRSATGALAGSVVYDTILRIANHGYNPADVTLSGYRILGTNGANSANVQKLVQENGVLRTELNKALQRLAAQPGFNPHSRPYPDMPGDFRYASQFGYEPGPYERQVKYGAMPPAGSIDAMPVSPNVAERQRKYGAMPFEQDDPKTKRERAYGFAAPKPSSSAAAMFNMQ